MDTDEAHEPLRGAAWREGRELRWVATGRGEPVVVLEAGLSGSSAGWLKVMEELGGSTRVLAYDRAGYGLSTPAEPSPCRAVADLCAVLDAAGAVQPVVLVGHSWGGVLARLFASAHPGCVAALVLVDATHEDLRGASSRAALLAGRAVARLLTHRARGGRLRRDLAAGRGRLAQVVRSAPAQHRPALVAHLSAPGTWEQTGRESRSIPAFLAAARAAGPPAVPVLALVGGRASGRREAATRQQVRDVYLAWLGDQAVRVLPEGGHMLPLDAPEAVARHVLEVVGTLRAQST